MHEFSIATSIAESVLEFCDKQSVKKVLEVRLSIGELTHIEAEQLRFCFAAITKETPIEEATLEIEPVAAVVTCPHCDYTGRPKYWDGALAGSLVPTLECPNCGNAASATEGHDCAIKAIKFVRDADVDDFEKSEVPTR